MCSRMLCCATGSGTQCCVEPAGEQQITETPEEARPICVGCSVRVRKDLKEPADGWGQCGVNHESVGVVIRVYCEGKRCIVDFPGHLNWYGLTHEMEVVEGSEVSVDHVSSQGDLGIKLEPTGEMKPQVSSLKQAIHAAPVLPSPSWWSRVVAGGQILPMQLRGVGRSLLGKPLLGRLMLAHEDYLSGKTGDAEPSLKWLRAAQRDGVVFPVLGSCREAVWATIEASGAGFRPQLIALEDHLSIETREMLTHLHQASCKRHLFSMGHTVIFCKTSDVVTRANDAAGTVSTIVSNARVGSSLQSLKQPLVFDGPPLAVDRMDENMRKEVASAAFWECHYDPDRTPAVTASYRVVLSTAIGVCLFVTMPYTFVFCDGVPLPFWRSLPYALACLAFGLSMWVTMTEPLGIRFSKTHQSLPGIVGGLLCWMVSAALPMKFSWNSQEQQLSEFSIQMACCFAVLLQMLILSCLWHQTSRFNAAWFFLGFAVCVFGLFALIPGLFVLYKLLLDSRPVFANIFLALAFGLVEPIGVQYVRRVYTCTVSRPRQQRGANAVTGDQKLALTWGLFAVRVFSESGRIFLLLIGTVRHPDYTFLVALGISFVLAVLQRTWYLQVMFGCLFAKCPAIQRSWCPGFTMALHLDLKYAGGYPQYILLLGFFLARGLALGNWSIRSGITDPTAWIFNVETLLAFIAAVAFSILEDIIVYGLNKSHPAPIFQTFRSAIVERGKAHNPFEFTQLFVPKDGQTWDTYSKDSSSKGAHLPSELAKNDILPAPNFIQLRFLTILEVAPLVIGVSTLLLAMFPMGLGYGAVFGSCNLTQRNWLLTLNLMFWQVVGCDE